MGGLRTLHGAGRTVTFLVGWLAIAGVPPLSGFFAKGDVLTARWAYSKPLWAIGLDRGGAHRVLHDAALRPRLHAVSPASLARGRAAEPALHTPHESPWVMRAPARRPRVRVRGGAAGLPSAPALDLERWLAPVFVGHALHDDLSDAAAVGARRGRRRGRPRRRAHRLGRCGAARGRAPALDAARSSQRSGTGTTSTTPCSAGPRTALARRSRRGHRPRRHRRRRRRHGARGQRAGSASCAGSRPATSATTRSPSHSAWPCSSRTCSRGPSGDEPCTSSVLLAAPRAAWPSARPCSACSASTRMLKRLSYAGRGSSRRSSPCSAGALALAVGFQAHDGGVPGRRRPRLHRRSRSGSSWRSASTASRCFLVVLTALAVPARDRPGRTRAAPKPRPRSRGCCCSRRRRSAAS